MYFGFLENQKFRTKVKKLKRIKS